MDRAVDIRVPERLRCAAHAVHQDTDRGIQHGSRRPAAGGGSEAADLAAAVRDRVPRAGHDVQDARRGHQNQARRVDPAL
eukprot:173772-Prymnesium_polylepis.1